jgi:peptidoglycan-associated lipoprotein
LSKRRARAVERALVERGVDSARIEVKWFGERRPVAAGDGEAAWAANRRAEIAWRGSE